MQEGTFLGALEVDIDTPSYLRDKFSEMTPTFKNVEFERGGVREHAGLRRAARHHDHTLK